MSEKRPNDNGDDYDGLEKWQQKQENGKEIVGKLQLAPLAR